MLERDRRRRLPAFPPPKSYSWFASADPRQRRLPASTNRACRVRGGARASGGQEGSWLLLAREPIPAGSRRRVHPRRVELSGDVPIAARSKAVGPPAAEGTRRR